MTAAVDLEVHPYATEFPPASEEELEDLTASVAAAGRNHVLAVVARTVAGQPDGRLADGRNRREACRRAGVEFRVEEQDFESDDALKEFVIGVNTTGRRGSMTVQIAAASTALILGSGKRSGGRWERNTHTHGFVSMDRTTANVLAQCGVVLDILGPGALREVRDGTKTLNAAYDEAQQVKRDNEAEADRAAAEEAAEAEARTFIEAERPDLAAEVGTNPLIADWRTAVALHEQQHREEVAARKREEMMRAAARQEELNAWGRACDGLRIALSWASDFKPPEDTANWPTVDQFIERATRLAKIAESWKESE